MGNCMLKTCCLPVSRKKEEQHGDKELESARIASPQKQQQEDGEIGVSCEKVKASNNGSGGTVRVKIVLTREELQWLMMELKSNNGEKRLENMLEEIERGRNKVVSVAGNGNKWKPGLESIKEIPHCSVS